MLNRGNPGNKGGIGRPSNALKKLCCKLIKEKSLVQRWAKIGAGEPVQVAMGAFGPVKDKDGSNVMVPASITCQSEAIEKLLDRGYGKPAQALEHSGPDGGPVSYAIVNYAPAPKPTEEPKK